MELYINDEHIGFIDGFYAVSTEWGPGDHSRSICFNRLIEGDIHSYDEEKLKKYTNVKNIHIKFKSFDDSTLEFTVDNLHLDEDQEKFYRFNIDKWYEWKKE